MAVTHSKISLSCSNKATLTPKVLCLPKDNTYIKEIEMSQNYNIGSIIKLNQNTETNTQRGGTGLEIMFILSGVLASVDLVRELLTDFNI